MLHLALVMSCIVLGAVFTLLAGMGVLGVPGLPPATAWVAAPAVAALIVLRTVLHRRAAARAGGPAWTPERLASVIVIWAVEEGGYLLGALLWALLASPAPLVLAGVAFALLLWDRPARLEARA